MIDVIENTADLQKLCAELSQHPFVTVDLEFLREHTYYAKLCLIQVGSLSRCAIIDPLAADIDLSAFFDLMINPDVTKVFHSGRQDIEIIYNLSHRIPTPLFDTQIAGMVTGFGESISYENLVHYILHQKIDKSNRLSDWSKRPLTNGQLEYALADVTHLVHIYQHLNRMINSIGRTEWIKDEMDILSNPATYETNPREAWQKIKHRSHSSHFLTVLRELASWRETRAQRKNTPRHSLIKDDALLTICAICPNTKEELTQIRNLRKDIAVGRVGDEIIEVLDYCKTIPEADYVCPPKIHELPDKNTSLHELLKLLLKIVSQQENVVARLIATEDDIKDFCSRRSRANPILKGWRAKIFGHRAVALRDGNLAVRFDPKTQEIVFEDISEQSA